MRRVFLCLLLVFAACAESDQAGDVADTDPTPAATESTDESPSATDEDANEDEKTKPKVDIPDGDPPKKLVIEDIEEGTGAEAEEDSTVTAHYVGVSWSTGEEFDSSWDRGAPTPFSLTQVIEGWTRGIPGMKVGGRRRLEIPPDLAYGDQPPPNSTIKPGETLVFVIDLVAVE